MKNKIICNNCYEKNNLNKTMFCRVCGNNLNKQFFEDTIDDLERDIFYKEELKELAQYCLDNDESFEYAVANRYKYYKYRSNIIRKVK